MGSSFAQGSMFSGAASAVEYLVTGIILEKIVK